MTAREAGVRGTGGGGDMPPPPPPPRPVFSEQSGPQEIRSEQECSLGTPFGTQFTQSLNPVPNELPQTIKLGSERKCSLAKAFV